MGLVLTYPNKWTGKIKQYIVEVGRNLGNFQDALSERSEPGLNIFRLKERLHFINAEAIWWASLK